MTIQTEMPFTGNVSSYDVATVKAFLLRNAGWFSAADLCGVFYTETTENSKRWLRRVVARAVPDIISGDLGYKHIDCATTEEIHHAIHRMESQIAKETARVLALRRRAHGRIG